MHMIFWCQTGRMYLVGFLKHLALPAFPLSHSYTVCIEKTLAKLGTDDKLEGSADVLEGRIR